MTRTTPEVLEVELGKRGPRPDLPLMQRLKGNPSKTKLRPDGPKAKGRPTAPKYLGDEARGIFEMIVRDMPPGVYAAIDAGAISAFAEAWADHEKATRALNAEGYMVVGSQGQQVINPWYRIKSDATAKMMTAGDKIGADPKARAALAVPPEGAEKSKFAGLIGQSWSSDSLSS